MAQCAWKPCGQKVQAGWQFCPYCGTDNRPSTFRPGIIACPHLFHESESFCVRCGSSRDGRPSAEQRQVQAGIGKKFITLGVIVAGASFGAQQIHENHYPGNEYIAPYYDEVSVVDGKKSVKGDEYVSWGETGGAVLGVLGVLALIIARINAGLRRKPSAKPKSA